jgi:hypothetical protein
LLVTVGVETYFLVSNFEANIIRLIEIRLYPQEFAEKRFDLRHIPYGIDE